MADIKYSNAGELSERLAVVLPVKSGENISFETVTAIWGKAEQTGKTNLFSQVGLGEKSVNFITRKFPLTLHNAIKWGEKHCFITSIREFDRRFYEIEAAVVNMKTFTGKRVKTLTDENNFTHAVPDAGFSFPAVMVEKYLGSAEEKARYETEIRYVLVTPKLVELDSGELVIDGDDEYRVMICHTLDAYKNEYEVERKEDD